MSSARDSPLAVFHWQPAAKTLQFAPMKFVLAILAFLVIAAILGVGILQLLAGKPWLLIFGAAGFVALFARYGCKSH